MESLPTREKRARDRKTFKARGTTRNGDPTGSISYGLSTKFSGMFAAGVVDHVGRSKGREDETA